MTVGEKIRKIRKERRITQRELADMLGTTYQYVSAVERDERNPKTDTIKKFANALGVSLDRLAPQFGNNTEEKPVSDTHFQYNLSNIYYQDYLTWA